MTLTLDLAPELEKRLAEEASRAGMTPDAWTLQLLEKHLLEQQRRQAAIQLIQSWIDDDDVEEQKETGDYLIKALDEDRLSDRKLFPPELKGISW